LERFLEEFAWMSQFMSRNFHDFFWNGRIFQSTSYFIKPGRLQNTVSCFNNAVSEHYHASHWGNVTRCNTLQHTEHFGPWRILCRHKENTHVCCSVLQCVLQYLPVCVAVCSSVCCSMFQCVLQYLPACCSMLQCVLQYVLVCVAACSSVCCTTFQCVLQYILVFVAVCSSALQYVPVCVVFDDKVWTSFSSTGLTWMSHVTHEWVMSQICMSHVHWRESYHTWLSHVTHDWVMSHMSASLHIRVSHGIRKSTCHTYAKTCVCMTCALAYAMTYSFV